MARLAAMPKARAGARSSTVLFLVLGFVSWHQTASAQLNPPPAFSKKVPDTVQDLEDIEKHVRKVVKRVLSSTVGLRIGQGQGSGVVIDRLGHILTAGHVSGNADQTAIIILHDGSKLTGRTLGSDRGIDSGMVVLTEHANLPSSEMAHSSDVRVGQWCLALGHPNGYKPGRPPVVRLGRVLEISDKAIVTDCTLVGGDSGGPLFDMHGRVIGIHSRIGGAVSANVHVPIDTYRDNWTRLAAGQVWGKPFAFLAAAPSGEQPYLGMKAAKDRTTLKVESVTPGSPAERAGLMKNDTIFRVDNYKMGSVEELGLYVRSKRPGVQITLYVRRGGTEVDVPVVLGRRSDH